MDTILKRESVCVCVCVYLYSSQTKVNLSLAPSKHTPSFSLSINPPVEAERPQAVLPFPLNHPLFIHLYTSFIPHSSYRLKMGKPRLFSS